MTLHYANVLTSRVGEHGLEESALERALPRLRNFTEQLNATRGTGWERWRLLPFDPVRRKHVHAVRAIADELRPKTDNLIVLGIGGSALGNIALHAALNPLTYNIMPREERAAGGAPRLFVLDNVDPQFVGQVLDEIRRDDPRFERTIVNVISKSGETAETAAQFLIARAMLKDALGDQYARHIVAVTDAEKGTMRRICDREGYATLPVPEGVGGRFSVLSPVGLFSAAMCGNDIDALLDGAAAMDERCSNVDVAHNPAATLAWFLIEFTRRGKSNHVLMPYCNGLYSLAEWYRQLWAESLGKRVDRDGREVFAGATPIKALGATDQHSQIQLYREGPNDKVIGFVEVERFEHDLTIPSDLDEENLRYLHGRTLGELINAEKRATEFALLESKRPNFTIRFPEVNAYHVGEFLQLWMITTAYAGLMLNIDAYDQPAVETGKVATFGLMGRTGYEDWKAKVDATVDGGTRIA
jgi:glucose-6-phosphate isomerase